MAVKVLYPQFSLDMAYLQRFVREAKVASGLTTPTSSRCRITGRPEISTIWLWNTSTDRTSRRFYLNVGTCPGKRLPGRPQVCLALDHAFQFASYTVTQAAESDDGGRRSRQGPGFWHCSRFDDALTDTDRFRWLSILHFTGTGKGRTGRHPVGQILFGNRDLEMLTGRVPFDADNRGRLSATYRKRTAISMRLGCRDSTRGWRPRAHRQSKAPEARFQTPLLMLEAIDAMLAKTHDIPETESPTSADLREKLRADTNREQKQPSTEIGHRRSRHSRM